MRRRRPACHSSDWPSGKLYPVTAAQLLPILTGFLAPIHFSKLAKNQNEGLAAHARRCKNYLSHGDKSPTQGYDRGVGCHCFFLLRESLKNHVAFVTRRDRAGDVPKVIGSVLFNHTVENSLKLCADLSGRVQVVLMTLLPRIERLRLCQNFLQKFVADDQLARRFKRTDRATKPQQCFLIDRIVREILDDYAPALGQAFRCACNRFIE